MFTCKYSCCSSVGKIKSGDHQDYTGAQSDVIAIGYAKGTIGNIRFADA